MSQSYIGSILVIPFGFAPRGFALCDGQLLSISTYQALFSLIGTTYGGNGTTNFALPDMRGRVALSSGQGEQSNYTPGAKGGAQSVPLTQSEMPLHSHQVPVSSSAGTVAAPNANFLANGEQSGSTFSPYHTSPILNKAEMASSIVSKAGNSAPHENQQPFMGLNFCIALTGIFPPRN